MVVDDAVRSVAAADFHVCSKCQIDHLVESIAAVDHVEAHPNIIVAESDDLHLRGELAPKLSVAKRERGIPPTRGADSRSPAVIAEGRPVAQPSNLERPG